MKKTGFTEKRFVQIAIVILTFWVLDFVFHNLGVGESNYYFISKFANALLFAVLWFFVFYKKESWKKIVYSVIFGTWISFYYLVSSYSGLVQLLGVYARYSPPPFVIGDVFLSPLIWWVFHGLTLYLGLEIADLISKK